MRTTPEPNVPSPFPWAFVGLAFGIAWAIWLPGVLATYGLVRLPVPAIALVAIGQFGPSLAACLLVARTDGRRGLLGLLRRAFNLRVPLPWLAVIVLVPLALAAGALAIVGWFGEPLPAMPLLEQPAMLPLAFIGILLLQGPLPEELGWRGYLLDRLLPHWGAFGASLVIGAIWAFWHLPLFFIHDVTQSYLPFGAYVLLVIAFSCFITWVYIQTGRSLGSALLIHTMINLSIAMFPPITPVLGAAQPAFLALTGLYLLLAAGLGLGWRRRARSADAARPPAPSHG